MNINRLANIVIFWITIFIMWWLLALVIGLGLFFPLCMLNIRLYLSHLQNQILGWILILIAILISTYIISKKLKEK